MCFFFKQTRKFLLLNTNGLEKQLLTNFISELATVAPFTGLGLFSVDLTTFTSILSTVLTYVIIMLQMTTPDPQQIG